MAEIIVLRSILNLIYNLIGKITLEKHLDSGIVTVCEKKSKITIEKYTL